jgi:pantoate--beta-alanine ligase
MLQMCKAVSFQPKNIVMNNIKIFESISEFQKYRNNLSGTVGFVPTMGALHEGHATLLRRAAVENENSILSIYVNPTQFNNSADLEKYPKTLDADLKLASDCGITAVLLPSFSEIYSDNYRFKLSENEFSEILCGAHRIGHFDGVLTVVMKFLNITRPNKAYFGEKDFQQLKLIEDMCKSFFMQTEIIREKTVREKSGLAMSSRNKRLSAEGLEKAALIYKLLTTEKHVADVKQKLIDSGFEIDYVEDIQNRRFIAASLEGVRLIDNVEI